MFEERDTRNERRRDTKRDVPVKGFRTDGLKLVPLLPPRPPARVLKTHAVGDGVLLAGHAAPRAPYGLIFPVMGEVVDLAFWLSVERGVIRDGVVSDGDEEDGEIAVEGGWNRHG